MLIVSSAEFSLPCGRAACLAAAKLCCQPTLWPRTLNLGIASLASTIGFDLMALEILHRALVFLGGRSRLEGTKVAAFAVFRILLARIKAVPARFQLADHRYAFLSRSG